MTARRILFWVGALAAAFGLFFLLQGLGIVRWPQSSTMVDRSEWVLRGALIAALGLLLVWRSRRRRTG